MAEIWEQLTKEIKKHDHIIIMAHKDIDFDALGSSLCFYQIVESFGKKVSLFLEKCQEEHDNPGISKALSKIAHLNIHIIYPNHYKEYIDENTLLVILDTHKIDRVVCPHLLDLVKDKAVIDHHVKGSHYIKDTVFSYMNSGLSSINEFMVGYLKYLEKTVDPMVATIMLTGIEIDTNNFHIKTTELTYEAAAFLMHIGADNIEKLELLKENKDDYLKRLDFVKKSEMINDNMALCILDDTIVLPKDLAIISESLLLFDNVDAAFTIGRTDEKVISISARSIGKIDVEEYMKALGGGGHLTDAACQLENISLKEAKQELLQVIKR